MERCLGSRVFVYLPSYNMYLSVNTFLRDIHSYFASTKRRLHNIVLLLPDHSRSLFYCSKTKNFTLELQSWHKFHSLPRSVPRPIISAYFHSVTWTSKARPSFSMELVFLSRLDSFVCTWKDSSYSINEYVCVCLCINEHNHPNEDIYRIWTFIFQLFHPVKLLPENAFVWERLKYS